MRGPGRFGGRPTTHPGSGVDDDVTVEDRPGDGGSRPDSDVGEEEAALDLCAAAVGGWWWSTNALFMQYGHFAPAAVPGSGQSSLVPGTGPVPFVHPVEVVEAVVLLVDDDDVVDLGKDR